MHQINFIHALLFETLKVLTASLGMHDSTHVKLHLVKLHHQFVTLIIDVHLHAKNQLYTSNSFWDIKD